MSWLLFFVYLLSSHYSSPSVNKLPNTLVTQQGVGTGNLRLHDAEAQPEKVGWRKFGSRMPLVKTGVVT